MTQLDARPAADTEFDRTARPVPVDGASGTYSVELDDGWASLAGIHGGYMVAAVVLAAEAEQPDRRVRTVTTSFLTPGAVGPATITTRPVRTGRTLSTVAAELVQGDRVVLTSRITAMVERTGPDWQRLRPNPLPPPADCVAFDPPPGLRAFGRAEAAFDPARGPFDPDRNAVVGYIRPIERRMVDAAWLAMASDWFPPPAFSRVTPPTGGVSIDHTIHVHDQGFVLDADDWLVGDFEIPTSSAGLGVEHGLLTRTDGRLVAESFQTRLTAQ